MNVTLSTQIVKTYSFHTYLYCFTDFKILEWTFISTFKSNSFQLNSDRTALFVKLKRWKTLSKNQIIKFASVKGTVMQIQILVIQVLDMWKWSSRLSILRIYIFRYYLTLLFRYYSVTTQPAIACSKSTMETLEQGVKYVKS